MERLASITKALSANFGVRLDVGGERIFFTTNDGQRMSNMDALITVTKLLFMTQPGAIVGVPVTVPRVLEEIAETYGGEIRRLKTDASTLMKTALMDEFAMLADAKGCFIFPHFTPFADGLFAIVKIMEMTAQAGQTLSDIWHTRPSYHLARACIPCQWEAKGKIMRILHEYFYEARKPGIEGIQLFIKGDWILILPDSAEASFWIHAEGATQERANELVNQYHRYVKKMIVV
jgi:mannose-1-phosphate guanylyltransferase/phosphomannomutase